MRGRATAGVDRGFARRVHRAAALALAALLGLACERKAPAPPTAPPVVLPPLVEAVYPPARSTGIYFLTPVWVQFAVALDTTTASDRSVFIKADTRRLPITLSWDQATRRLAITPLGGLALRQTYTVELASTLRLVDGRALGQTYAWQFTTNSLFRPQSPLPMDGRRDQSAFVALRWGGLTGSPGGPVAYEIHAGPDSAQVADPADPPLAVVATGTFVPRTRWRQEPPRLERRCPDSGPRGSRTGALE